MVNVLSKYLSFVYPSAIWRVKSVNRNIYLTFDDGPHPQATPFVLDVLKKHNVKATFFCVGSNIEKHYDLFNRIIAEGHTVGNHTYTHLNGFKTGLNDYLKDVERCQNLYNFKFFRPPYGKITPGQFYSLKSKFKIVMWSALSKDYAQNYTSNDCFRVSVKNAFPGAVLVFHDSQKAYRNLTGCLEKTVIELKKMGYYFKSLD